MYLKSSNWFLHSSIQWCVLQLKNSSQLSQKGLNFSIVQGSPFCCYINVWTAHNFPSEGVNSRKLAGYQMQNGRSSLIQAKRFLGANLTLDLLLKYLTSSISPPKPTNLFSYEITLGRSFFQPPSCFGEVFDLLTASTEMYLSQLALRLSISKFSSPVQIKNCFRGLWTAFWAVTFKIVLVQTLESFSFWITDSISQFFRCSGNKALFCS